MLQWNIKAKMQGFPQKPLKNLALSIGDLTNV